MFNNIPFSFKNKNEEYFIINNIQQFCNENNLPTSLDKVELLNRIEEFGKMKDDNGIKVMSWADKCLKEGIKKILITSVEGTRRLRNRTSEEWKLIINRGFAIESCKYILEAENFQELKLCKYTVSTNNNVVEKISFNFTILLKEQKGREDIYNTIIYPIFIDLYVQNSFIVGRAKSKSSLYKYFNDDEQIGKNISCDLLIQEAFSIIYEKLGITRASVPYNMDLLKRKLHKMVDECTNTPESIVIRLDREIEWREKFVKEFFFRQAIDITEGDYYKDALHDLKIFMEKYISITTKDKGIFTEDRYGYPIQISATDEDFSSVEETSSEEVPLQCTPIFFDNKRLIQKQKKCDNVLFVFKRNPQIYFTRKSYRCIIKELKGYLHLEFRKYVLEEDIDNVLSRIIGNN